MKKPLDTFLELTNVVFGVKVCAVMGETEARNKGHVLFELAGICIFFVYAGAVVSRMAGVYSGVGDAFILLVAAFVGYSFADWISGFVHWLGDRYGTESTPFLGPNFVKPFRDHHVWPKDLAKHDFVELNGNNCIVSFWVLMLCYHVMPLHRGNGWDLFWVAMLFFAMLGVFGTNQFHKWAHMDNPPKIALWMQKLHLVLPPKHHQIHHTNPFDTYYCITTGWMNPLLNRIQFFPGLERVIAVVLRIPTTPDVYIESS